MAFDAADPVSGSAAFPADDVTVALPGRWSQLAIGVLCMSMIANLQYGWTLFVDPIAAAQHWARPSVQTAFTIFVVTETWLVPVEAWFVDRYGPRPVVAAGGGLIALAWTLNSIATTLPVLYLAAFVGGVGAGCVYGTCVGNALKWFPHRRGLAAGATAAGFGAGAALTVVPIANMIKTSGYQQAFLVFGLAQGLVVLLAGLALRAPRVLAPVRRRALAIPQAKVDVEPATVVRQPVFWVMYAVFVMVAAGGLMTAASIAPIARDFGIATNPVTIAGFTMAALTFAISLDRILDGLGRPLFGFLSDRIGRENTMGLAFSTAAVMLLLLAFDGRDPMVFVLATAAYFAVFGEIYSLFPATAGDTFGAKFATTNAGMLYTAKGCAALIVPLAAMFAAAEGWRSVFIATVGLNLGAAFIALFVLKPMRLRYIEGSP